MPKAIQVPATLEGVSTLKDGGVSVRLHTQELSTDEKTTVLNQQGKFGWFLFAEQEFDESELELENIRKDVGGKTPAQRLRAVLYISYQQSGYIEKTFEQYYAEKMERFIDRVKRALND